MKMRKVAGRRAGDRRRTVDLGFEHCEDRLLLATFTVVNTLNNSSTSGSLAWAITQANQADIPESCEQLNTIDFNIPGTGPFTIDLSSGALPQVQYPLIIDGTSEPGYAAGSPMIEIVGSSLLGDGLVLTNSIDRQHDRGAGHRRIHRQSGHSPRDGQRPGHREPPRHCPVGGVG